LAIDGSLLVLPTPEGLVGIDLESGEHFAICRAVDAKGSPAVSGRTVAWLNWRNNTLGKFGDNGNVYAAILTPGPALLPPAYGVPATGCKDGGAFPTWTFFDLSVAEARDQQHMAKQARHLGGHTASPVEHRFPRQTRNAPSSGRSTGRLPSGMRW